MRDGAYSDDRSQIQSFIKSISMFEKLWKISKTISLYYLLEFERWLLDKCLEKYVGFWVPFEIYTKIKIHRRMTCTQIAEQKEKILSFYQHGM